MAIFEKIILCANASQLNAGVWRFGKLNIFETFQNDEQGQSSFKQFLQKTPNTNIHFLVDAPEEDYRLETLPHTRGTDRKALLERKLNQIYRGYSLRTALFIKRGKDDAKSDHFLFMALNNADFLQAWLSIIDEEQAPLAGVYLLSMTVPILAKRLKLNTSHSILTERLSTGLRQSYLQNGALRMSRFVSFPMGEHHPDASFYLAETEKARMYLSSQRYIASDTELAIVIPVFNQTEQAISKEIEAIPGLHCHHVDLKTLVKSLRLDQRQVEKTPELIHMDLVAKSRLVTSLADNKFTKYYRINVARESLNLATAATLVIGLMFSLVYFKQYFNQQSEQDALIVKTKHQQARYQQVAKDFPATPLPSSDLQLAVELNQHIKVYQRLPDRSMQIISNAMLKGPEIQINRLFWTQNNDANLKDSTLSVGIQNQENKTALPVLPTNELHEIVFLNAEIKRFAGDYRAALNSVNQLAERLKADANVAYVEILQAPVNVSSYTNLEGSTTDEIEAKQSAALFKLKVILKREGVVE